MPKSYHNHYLHVDLTARTASTFSLPDDVLNRYVGGKGVGAYLLAKHQDPAAPAFEPSNPLIFVVGPLTGTQSPAMRSVVVFKSPLTGLFADSYFGGFWGQELKSAGYDGMLITGQASEPVYLEIDDEAVSRSSRPAISGDRTRSRFTRPCARPTAKRNGSSPASGPRAKTG